VSERVTRRGLLLSGVGVAAAGTTAALLDSASASAASALDAESETTTLERLLSVELLGVFVYQHVLNSSLLTPHAKQVLGPLRGHEEAHVRVLTTELTVLGGLAPSPPANVEAADRDLARRSVTGRLGQLQGSHDAFDLLLEVERVVVGAYFVALTKLQDPQLITLAAQIMATDAQHEAIIGELLFPGNAQKAVPYALVQGSQ
jgi:hypothetical protein